MHSAVDVQNVESRTVINHDVHPAVNSQNAIGHAVDQTGQALMLKLGSFSAAMSGQNFMQHNAYIKPQSGARM
jgi:hypothetical protein